MTDLTPYMNRIEILNETGQQIIKDFGIVGINIKFSGNSENARAELFSQILPHVEKLQKENFKHFYDLMYRIDISEGQIQKAVEESKDKSFSQAVTDLILKRELLKVVFRKQYSAK